MGYEPERLKLIVWRCAAGLDRTGQAGSALLSPLGPRGPSLSPAILDSAPRLWTWGGNVLRYIKATV